MKLNELISKMDCNERLLVRPSKVSEVNTSPELLKLLDPELLNREVENIWYSQLFNAIVIEL